jgi:hypothetical protein
MNFMSKMAVFVLALAMLAGANFAMAYIQTNATVLSADRTGLGYTNLSTFYIIEDIAGQINVTNATARNLSIILPVGLEFNTALTAGYIANVTTGNLNFSGGFNYSNITYVGTRLAMLSNFSGPTANNSTIASQIRIFGLQIRAPDGNGTATVTNLTITLNESMWVLGVLVNSSVNITNISVTNATVGIVNITPGNFSNVTLTQVTTLGYAGSAVNFTAQTTDRYGNTNASAYTLRVASNSSNARFRVDSGAWLSLPQYLVTALPSGRKMFQINDTVNETIMIYVNGTSGEIFDYASGNSSMTLSILTDNASIINNLTAANKTAGTQYVIRVNVTDIWNNAIAGKLLNISINGSTATAALANVTGALGFNSFLSNGTGGAPNVSASTLIITTDANGVATATLNVSQFVGETNISINMTKGDGGDSVYNWSLVTINSTDTEVPYLVTATNLVAGQWIKGTYNLTGNASDNVRVGNVTINMSNLWSFPANITWNGSDNRGQNINWSYLINTSLFADSATLPIIVNASDSSGNQNVSLIGTLSIDNTVPNVSYYNRVGAAVSSNTTIMYTNANLTNYMAILILDPSSGVNSSGATAYLSSINISFNTTGAYNYSITSNAANTSLNVTINVTFPVTGLYVMNMNITDNAGNTNRTQRYFYVDMVPPFEINFTNMAAINNTAGLGLNITNEANITIDLSIQDAVNMSNETDTLNVIIQVNNKTSGTTACNFSAMNEFEVGIVNASCAFNMSGVNTNGGIYQISAIAFDRANNSLVGVRILATGSAYAAATAANPVNISGSRVQILGANTTGLGGGTVYINLTVNSTSTASLPNILRKKYLLNSSLADNSFLFNISFAYTASELTELGISDESMLVPMFYNTTSARWERVPGYVNTTDFTGTDAQGNSVAYAGKIVMTNLKHFTEFSGLAGVEANVTNCSATYGNVSNFVVNGTGTVAGIEHCVLAFTLYNPLNHGVNLTWVNITLVNLSVADTNNITNVTLYNDTTYLNGTFGYGLFGAAVTANFSIDPGTVAGAIIPAASSRTFYVKYNINLTATDNKTLGAIIGIGGLNITNASVPVTLNGTLDGLRNVSTDMFAPVFFNNVSTSWRNVSQYVGVNVSDLLARQNVTSATYCTASNGNGSGGSCNASAGASFIINTASGCNGLSGTCANGTLVLNLTSSGNITVNITAVDSAGNRNNSVFFVLVDLSAPDITNLTPGDNAIVNSSPTVNALATDTVSGIANLTLYINGSQAGNKTNLYNVSAAAGVNIFNFTTLAGGTHNISLIAENGAGSRTNRSWSFTVNGSFSLWVVIDLASGFNLIAIPMNVTNNSVKSVVSGINDSLVNVWHYDPTNGYVVYNTNQSVPNTLTSIIPGQAYFLNMSAPANLTIYGFTPSLGSAPDYPTRAAFSLIVGWNMVGAFINATNPANGSAMVNSCMMFRDIGGSTLVTGLTGYNSSMGYYSVIQSSSPCPSSSPNLVQGWGYWTYASSAGTYYQY